MQNSSKKLVLGIFGFGVVGQGLLDIINSKELNISIKRIGIKHPEKPRSLPAALFTADADEIINDPEITTVVELINDAAAAYQIVKKSLLAGKSVVSASKKMLAEHLEELIRLAGQSGTSLLYEGAVCASIPVIRNLEEYYDNELLHQITGIVNGSSNFILSKIYDQQMRYTEAVKLAQYLGFAETDPTLDVEGYDAKYKLSIIAAHAYGLVVDPREIFNYGIQHVAENDVRFSKEKGLRIKLIAKAVPVSPGEICLYVMPSLVAADDMLGQVRNEYNGVVFQAAFADKQFFFGKGAGGHPTGSAVLSDITALRYDYRYEYKKYHAYQSKLSLNNSHLINLYLRYKDDRVPALLNFEEITEKFENHSFKYLIGTIRLKHVVANAAVLESVENFMAEIPSIAVVNNHP